VAKSSRRKKQDRVNSAAKRIARGQHGEEMGSFLRLMDPAMPSREVTEVIASKYSGDMNAGTVAVRRIANGVPLEEVTAAARTLLAGAGDSPGDGILAWAAEAAHAEGDEDAEHRHVAEMLSQAEAADDTARRVNVIRSLSRRGHPGEAADLLQPHLRDHPDDSNAALTYSFIIREAAEMPDPGDYERAALARFANRSGLGELQDAVTRFIGQTKWNGLVERQTATTLGLLPDRRLLSFRVLQECTALAREASAKGTLDGIEGMTPQQIVKSGAGDVLPETALTAFAADPSTPPDLARRVRDWVDHGHYGLWQMSSPSPDPGVAVTDLVTGVRRYAEFPASFLEGAPRWSTWLGEVVPVDGIWHAAGTGFLLSPAESDAVADAVHGAIGRMVKMVSGMPPSELLPPDPVPYGDAAPWSARWDFDSSLGAEYARRTSGVVMMLAARLAANVSVRRAARAIEGDITVDPAPEDETWLDKPLLALHGLTPRQADTSDTGYQMLLEALLRQCEYESGLAARAGRPYADMDALREILTPSDD
jgi:hypothetical protein